MADESDAVYCYPHTDVLINHFNARDAEQLRQVERMLTGARLIELYRQPAPGTFDAGHLRRIHHHIFQDLYFWAGEFRVVDIAKGSLFCHAEYIEREVDRLLGGLRREHCLRRLERPQLIVRAAHYLSELNAIHPFRDGNGRTQREFLRELLLGCGLHADYSRIADPRDMIEASIAAYGGDNQPLIRLLDHCITDLNDEAECEISL